MLNLDGPSWLNQEQKVVMWFIGLLGVILYGLVCLVLSYHDRK